jgi:hypothetical protein
MLGPCAAGLTAVLALAGCSAEESRAGHPGPCDPRGPVIARAETLRDIKDALLQKRAGIAAVRVVAWDADDGLPLFHIQDARGRNVDDVLIWRQGSRGWLSAQFLPCQ